MLKRLPILVITVVLTFTLCHSQQSLADEHTPKNAAAGSSAPVTNIEARNDRLRTDTLKLAGGKTVSANPSDPEMKVKASDASTPLPDVEKDARRGDKLKQDVLKMLAEVKAGKTSIPSPQGQTKSINLSKRAKIAIVVGIVATIVVIAIVNHNKEHKFRGFAAGPLLQH